MSQSQCFQLQEFHPFMLATVNKFILSGKFCYLESSNHLLKDDLWLVDVILQFLRTSSL